MSVQQHKQDLAQISMSLDGPLRDIASSTYHFTEAFENGQLSKDEYIELLRDLERQTVINEAIRDLRLKQHLHTVITGLISLASLV